MPTEAKRETVAELTEEARGSTTMIVSEYRGLKVSELGEIRRSLRKQNVTYHVVKNRLMKIAARDAGAETLGLLLEGPTAVAFARGDEAAAAKAVLDAVRPSRLV
jgi:large subunit ribosomal protein L10